MFPIHVEGIKWVLGSGSSSKSSKKRGNFYSFACCCCCFFALFNLSLCVCVYVLKALVGKKKKSSPGRKHIVAGMLPAVASVVQRKIVFFLLEFP